MNSQALDKRLGQKATAAVDIAPEKAPSTGGGIGPGQHIPMLSRDVLYKVAFFVAYPFCGSVTLYSVLEPSPFSLVAFFVFLVAMHFMSLGSHATKPSFSIWPKKHNVSYKRKDYHSMLKERGKLLLHIFEYSLLAFPLMFLVGILLSGVDDIGVAFSVAAYLALVFGFGIMFCFMTTLHLVFFAFAFKSINPMERLARFIALSLSIYVFSVLFFHDATWDFLAGFTSTPLGTGTWVNWLDLDARVELLAMSLRGLVLPSLLYLLTACLLVHYFVLYAEKRGGYAFHDKVASYLGKNYGKGFDEKAIKQKMKTIKAFKWLDKYKYAFVFLSIVYFVVMSWWQGLPTS